MRLTMVREDGRWYITFRTVTLGDLKKGPLAPNRIHQIKFEPDADSADWAVVEALADTAGEDINPRIRVCFEQLLTFVLLEGMKRDREV